MTVEARQAFLTAIEKAHGRKLRSYLATRMRNAVSEVSDLAQEVYLRLLRIDDHETIRNPQAYLFTVASHVLHQHALRNAVVPEMVEIAEVVSELQSVAESDPALQVEIEQRFEALGRGLQQISPRAYATLVLHRCDGVPLRDIAEQMGVSYSMTKKYLAKALRYCQQHLDATE